MRATIATLVCVCGAALSGCALPSPGFLDDYATVGGKWQRSNPTSGRVGSIFSDAGSTESGAIMSDVAGDYGEYSGEIVEGEYYSGEYYEGEYYSDVVDDYYGPDAANDDFYDTTTDSDMDEGVIILGDDW